MRQMNSTNQTLVTKVNSTQHGSGLLRFALFSNALFSIFCIVNILLYTPNLSKHLSLSTNDLYGLVVGLSVFVCFLLWLATRKNISLALALLVSMSDFVWVMGSIAFVGLWPDVTSYGSNIVFFVATFVGLAGVAQYMGIWRIVAEYDSSLGTSCRLSLQYVVDVPRESFWGILSDLGNIYQYGEDLKSSCLRDNSKTGLGAVRECANHKDQKWAERCIGYEELSTINLEFLADEEGFPFPVEKMIGGWILEQKNENSTLVTLWWSYIPKPSYLAIVFTVLTEFVQKPKMQKLLENMAQGSLSTNKLID